MIPSNFIASIVYPRSATDVEAIRQDLAQFRTQLKKHNLQAHRSAQSVCSKQQTAAADSSSHKQQPKPARRAKPGKHQTAILESTLPPLTAPGSTDWTLRAVFVLTRWTLPASEPGFGILNSSY
jgi:hypothetical protein